ncbi:hypothetical protein [Clostridium cylindrosporum]|uniref:Uncharacterized protein n=1 Tax=Clostridium cylindrosporum DSM 605 TaxID=1121307 RepID=A0A0J8DC89_CLOCY|nr:hypothetical protein [Clostridium cylindrosporum]KMT21873.1 hypothetical protein CLCY_3c01440 [Clostridium cylindrosporum DSM 605]
MSFFSSSSNKHHKHKHHGSKHYKKTGFLDKLFNAFLSKSHSGKKRHNVFTSFSSSDYHRKHHRKKYSSWS